MYRKTHKTLAKLEAMRNAKERKRLTGAAPDYPPMLPDLRRTIIVIDYEGGHKCGRTERMLELQKLWQAIAKAGNQQ